MEYPLISVILPTYNRASIIEASVQSTLNQTYDNLEVLIINDCSSDATYKILQNLAKSDNRVKVYHNRRRIGLPASRNKGISLSNGSLIFFSEDDLVLDPSCISILVHSFDVLSEANQLTGAVGPRLITMPQGPYKRKLSQQRNVVWISPITGEIKCNFELNTSKPIEVETLHSCSLISRNAILRVGGFESKLYQGSYTREETDFYFRLRRNGYKLYFEPRAFARHYYGRIGGCILSSKFSQEYYNIRNHLMFLVRFYGLSAFFMFPCFMGKFLLNKCAGK